MEKSDEYTSTSLIEAFPDAIFIADSAGNVTDVNSKAILLTGHTKEELLRMNTVRLIVPGREATLWHHLLQQTHCGPVVGQLHNKSNRPVPVEISITGISEGMYCTVARDITEKIRVEDEVSKMNERFNLLSKATMDAIWDLDLTTNIMWVNDNFLALYGLKASWGKLSYDLWSERIHHDDKERVFNKLTQALGSGEAYWQDEYRFLIPDGSYRIFYDRGYISRNGAGEAVRMTGVMTDLTTMKTAEQALKLSEEKFTKAFFNNVAGVAIWDENGHFLEVNRSFEKMVEFTRDEMIGKTSSQIGLVSEETRLNLINELTKQGSIANLEVRIITKTGRVVTALSYLSIIEVNGQTQRLNTFFDITEKMRVTETLRQSEEQYRLLFNVTPIPAWVIDNDTQDFLQVNEAAIKHYGFSREEFLAMNAREIRPAIELEKFDIRTSGLLKSFNGDQGLWKHLKKDGSIIDVEIVSHDIVYEKKTARLVLANDVTEKFKIEMKMKQMNEELRSLSMHLQEVREEERIHIAREIHDELGQQLTGLKMYVHGLKRKLDTTNEPILKKIQEILQLIDDIIRSVRKIATTLRPSMLDDLGLVAAMEWLSQEVEKRSEIKINFTSHVPVIEITDDIKTGLFRIYQEALTNVVRHAQAKQINSKLQLESNNILLEVTDDGKGFIPEANSNYNNNTFGLLGIKERINKLNGKFELKSEPGKGTTITIYIPLL